MLNLRYMEQEDIVYVADLEKKYFSIPWSEKSLKKELENKDSIFIVAEYNGEIAGYAGMYIMSYEAGITNVVVGEKFRQQGIGDAIVKKLLEEGEKAGVLDITLEVRKSNVSAIKLYQNNDFISEGIRPGFYEHPKEDAIIMWRRRQK